MARFIGIVLSSLLLLTACTSRQKSSTLPQDRFVRVYFNHRQNSTSYTEPYRQLERSGDNLESIIIEAITAANSTIDLAVQELNLPLVAKALATSHRSGIEVRVILDNNYSRSLSEFKTDKIAKFTQRDRQKYRQLFQLVDVNRDNRLTPQEIAERDAIAMLRQAGIPIIDDTADGSKGSGLMHHKFMVIDGKTVITGSANFTLSGIHGDLDNPATRGNVNHLFRIENERVAELFTAEFNYMWGDSSNGGINSKFGLAKPWRSPQTVSWENTQITLQFAPTSSSQDWRISTNGLIDKTLKEASESVDLALFVFSEQKIANTLEQKQREGVEIRGVFDAGFAYRYYSEVLDMLGVTLYFRCQAEAENNPWQDSISSVGTPQIVRGDKLHHKFAIVDRASIITGSQNWSKAANQTNDETLMAIDNPIVSQHFQREFERLYSSASLGLTSKLKQKQQQQQRQCS